MDSETVALLAGLVWAIINAVNAVTGHWKSYTGGTFGKILLAISEFLSVTQSKDRSGSMKLPGRVSLLIPFIAAAGLTGCSTSFAVLERATMAAVEEHQAAMAKVCEVKAQACAAAKDTTCEAWVACNASRVRALNTGIMLAETVHQCSALASGGASVDKLKACVKPLVEGGGAK